MQQLQFNFLKQILIQPSILSDINYELVRSKRKTLALHVMPDQTLQVRAPLKMSLKVIENFVQKHQSWIEKRKKKIKKHAYMFDLKLDKIQCIPIFGKNLNLNIIQSSKCAIAVSESALFFYVSGKIKNENKSIYFNKALTDFSKHLFEKKFKECFEYFNTVYAQNLPKLSIKTMKRQWGNYNKQKHQITLNSKLIHLPETCLESVIYHELCHTRYFSHGPRFYKLLDKIMPSWKVADKILKNLE